jgi:DNA-binding MarR family transcriptional regulator
MIYDYFRIAMNRIAKESQEIANLVHSTSIHLLRTLRQEDSKTGLNAPRLSALSVLVFRGPITLGDLAAAEQVRPPTMSRIVDALVELGLATRTRSKEDKRIIHINSTRKGTDVMHAGRERRVRVLARAIKALDPQQREHMRSAFQLLKTVIAGM